MNFDEKCKKGMTDKKKELTLAIGSSVLYMLLVGALVPFVYGIIDDRSMMEIVSGQYLGHPDAHTIFIGYWYSLLLSALYGLLPNVDWYALLYLMMQGACMSLVGYRLLSRAQDRREKLLYLLLTFLLFGAFGIRALTQLTFTTTAAVLSFTVLFWYLTAKEITYKDVAVLFVLGFLACQVRVSVFYMVVPVCGVLWLFRLRDAQMRQKWHLCIPLAVLGILLLQECGDVIGYGSPEWQTYETYNQERSEVYDYADYTFPIYEEAADFYQTVGIEKKSRARTLMNYNYTADERISPEFFGGYIEAYRAYYPAQETFAAKLLQSIKEYGKGALSGRFQLQHIGALALLGLLVLWHFFKGNKMLGLEIITVTGVQMVLWVYLLYEGRIPNRVIYTMNLMLTATACFYLAQSLKGLPRGWKTGSLYVVCVLLCVLFVVRGRDIRQQNLRMSRQNKDIETLKEYCMEHPDCFYFNDVTSLAFTTYNVHLWQTEPYQMNYMSLGDWMSFSPIWEEKLRQEQITSVKRALYEQEDVYLICSFDKGLEYLISLYEHVTCTEIDKIPGFQIYRLQSL